MVNLLGSRIEGVVQLPAALVSHVKSGDLRVLAVLARSAMRSSRSVPTASEARLRVALDMWRGHRVPKGAPKPVIAKLETRSSVRSRHSLQGRRQGDRVHAPRFLPSAEFAKLIATTIRAWRK